MVLRCGGQQYDIDRDPVWQHKPVMRRFDKIGWWHCNYLGTPHEFTDESGKIAWSGIFQAWGGTCETNGKAKRAEICNPVRLPGQYLDTEIGLHYNRYRYYDPRLGRFIGKDPIGFSGGLNVYQYAPNPLQWDDPRGLSPLSIIKAVAELRSGKSVTVCSYKEASAVLFGAFPGAQKSAGAGDKTPDKIARDKAAFKSLRQNGTGRASYHMDFKINPVTGVLYGHESLPDGHAHKTLPHINIVTPEGSRADIFIERNPNCPGTRPKRR
ncbi:RHS domain-containing protein [Pseudomonas putida]|nr:RHS domain-containing protein [Pseudomonas putida]